MTSEVRPCRVPRGGHGPPLRGPTDRHAAHLVSAVSTAVTSSRALITARRGSRPLLWIVLWRGLLHWLDLVILGLSHCYPMVTRLVLLSSQTYPMQKLKLILVLFHLLWFHLHQPGIASLLHWLDLVREMILGKLQSFSQTHLVHLSLGH